MHHWMFNCKEVTRIVSESLDRRLPIQQRMGLRIHLMMCRFCSRYRRQLLILRKAIRLHLQHGATMEPLVILLPEAKERIKSALNRK